MAEPMAPPRRLTRSTTDRMVAGVCGGLGEYTGIDPVVFRVIAVVAAILGGAGVAAYLIAWLVIPGGPGAESHADVFVRERNLPRAAVIVLAVLALLIVGDALDGPFDGNHIGGGGFGFVALVAVGVWLWARHQRDEAPAPPAPPREPAPVTGPAEPMEAVVPPPRPRRERSRLFALTMSAALLTAGVLGSLQAADAVDLDAGQILAVCLAVVGGGLVVGAWVGRARGLVAVGVVLTVATVAATVADVPLRGGIGERTWHPRTAAALADEYHLGIGEIVLDLSDVALGASTRHVEATVGVGHLEVIVPDTVDVVIRRAHTGMGAVALPGVEDGGIDVTRSQERPGTGPGRLVLELRVGMGRLEVHP